MKRLASDFALLITPLALAGSAVAKDGPLSATETVPALQTGVTTETKLNGFTLVTLGTWRTEEIGDDIASRAAAVHHRKTVWPNSFTISSFRRLIYLPHVQAAERRYALPPGLLDALVWTESRYNPLALSKSGAAGLGQLMPRTAEKLGVSHLYDARSNVMGAGNYLRQMIDQFGQIHLAVAAYNAGPGAVKASGGVPLNAETPSYVRNVLASWKKFMP